MSVKVYSEEYTLKIKNNNEMKIDDSLLGQMHIAIILHNELSLSLYLTMFYDNLKISCFMKKSWH